MMAWIVIVAKVILAAPLGFSAAVTHAPVVFSNRMA